MSVDEIPEKPGVSECYDNWEVPSQVSNIDSEEKLHEDIYEFHTNGEWNEEKLKWIPLSEGQYKFNRHNIGKYENVRKSILRSTKLRPIRLNEEKNADKDEIYHLNDGRHRSSVPADMGYTHILANVKMIRRDEPKIEEEIENDKERILKSYSLKYALGELCGESGINAQNVSLGSSDSCNQEYENLPRREIRETLLSEKHIQRFAFLPNKNENNSLEVTDINEDQLTARFQLGDEKHVLSGQIPELRKKLMQLLVRHPLFLTNYDKVHKAVNKRKLWYVS